MNVLIAGDYCPMNRVSALLKEGKTNEVLGEVKSLTDASDYSIVNLECPITSDKDNPIPKCGPNLHCTEKDVEALAKIGFDCVTLANNHFKDYGETAVNNTLGVLSRLGLDVVGGGKNVSFAQKTLYKILEEKTLAIINCCEHEFSLSTKQNGGSNPLNPIQQYYAIKDAQAKADYILVIVHGGHEFYQLPSTRMQDTYRFFIDAGADAVVNHHQHCFSGYELYKEKPIFYGLGNFCFDEGLKMSRSWYEGYMVSLSFNENISFEVHPYLQCKENAKVSLRELNDISNELSRLNRIIEDRTLLENSERDYYTSQLRGANLTLEPITNRIIRALQHRHLLPKFPFSRKYILRLYNFLLCEAHRDKINFFFETEYEKCYKS